MLCTNEVNKGYTCTNMTALKFEHVTKKFGKFSAVNNISFSVAKGEIVGFVGPNGAGKTTAISMLLGFIKPSRGIVSINGQNILPQNAHKLHTRIGYAAGDMALFDNLTGTQYLDYFANQYGGAPAYANLIKQLNPKLNVALKHLSRGNKQKIAIIGALQHQPDIVILDEPTSGLDPLMQKTFLELLLAEKARGATVFMSSHILSEVGEVSDRVLFMRDGNIIVNQPLSEIKGKDGKLVTVAGEIIKQIDLPKGSSELTVNSNTSSFVFEGDSRTLQKWLSKQQVTDFTVENRTLDDLFEHLYVIEEQK